MGIASASFTITIRDENPLILVENLLPFLASRFLQPKSAEIHLPGRQFVKVEGSIDSGVFWGKHDLPSQLPGESVDPATGFTTLDKPESWLTIPRDLSRIMDLLREYSEESSRLWKAKVTTDDDVFFAFWGLCRLILPSQATTQNEGLVLRQQLSQARRLEPVLRITSHLVQHPRRELSLRLFTRSFVWSRYTSEFEAVKQDWIAKPQLQSERDNARLLAQAFTSFVLQYPNAEVEWEQEHQHSPDLSGFVPLELQARLGPTTTPQRVRNLESSG